MHAEEVKTQNEEEVTFKIMIVIKVGVGTLLYGNPLEINRAKLQARTIINIIIRGMTRRDNRIGPAMESTLRKIIAGSATDRSLRIQTRTRARIRITSEADSKNTNTRTGDRRVQRHETI